MQPDSPQAKAARRVGIISLILCAAGLADSIYLTIDHYAKVPLACPDKGLVNCQLVTHSSYATQFGIPLPVFGLVFFVVAISLFSPWAWRLEASVIRLGRLAFAAVGTVSVLWLIWVEFARLKHLCLYCSGVHALTVVLFIVAALGTVATSPDPEGDDGAEDGWDDEPDDDHGDGDMPVGDMPVGDTPPEVTVPPTAGRV